VRSASVLTTWKEALVTGVELIAAERQRQMEAEGWTPEHDDVHDLGEMAAAAVSYAMHPFSDARIAGAERDFRNTAGMAPPAEWPWDAEWWKPTPKDRVRELTKAGALLAAEIDRLQRASS
jgi:hypothetical protein